MSGFFKGAKIDLKFAKKQAKELSNVLLPSIVLTHKPNLSKVNKEALSGWVNAKIEDSLGVDDEILVGTILNTLEESRAEKPKELQHTLTSFLGQDGAREFMEGLWEMMIDAEASEDGIPKSWSTPERAKYLATNAVEKETAKEKGSPIRLGLRSPERVVGRFIEETRRDYDQRDDRQRGGRDEIRRERNDRPYERPRSSRYYDREPSRERHRSRERRMPSPESHRGRSRSDVKRPEIRNSSVDTYKTSNSNVSSKRSSRSPSRKHHHHRSSHHDHRHRHRSRSPSTNSNAEEGHRHRKKHHHHKKRHHRRHHHHRESNKKEERSASPVAPEAGMSELEKMLRQKALESIQSRSATALE